MRTCLPVLLKFASLFAVWTLATESIPAQATGEEFTRQVTGLETRLGTLAMDLDRALANPIVSGTILMWSGSASSVPVGWALCDGANGTPDLRKRFVRGASESSEVGEAGGSASHTHPVAGHEHPVPALGHGHTIGTVDDIRTDLAGAHTHQVGIAIGSAIHVDQLGFGGVAVAAEGHHHVLFTNRPSQHRHVLRISGTGTVGTQGTNTTSIADSTAEGASHLPPYYILCYIMKRSEDPTKGWQSPAGLDLPGRVSALAEATAALSSHLKATAADTLPAGLVAFWSGAAEKPPASWAVCDGANGTPDLRNRFIRGASELGDMDEEGGSLGHPHTTRAHSHPVTMPYHSHAIPSVATTTQILPGHAHTFGGGGGDDYSADPSSDRYDKASLDGHTHILSVAGAHAHGIVLPATSTERNTAEGWTGLADCRLLSAGPLPPYYALRFLVKRTSLAGFGTLKFVPLNTSTLLRVEAMEKAVAELSRAAAQAATFSVPAGVIAPWSGSLASLPAGWTICNGRNGTPDLRGQFVAGGSAEPNPGGGSIQHSHNVGAHSHTAYFPHTHNRPARELQTRTVVDAEHSVFEFETGHTHSSSGFAESVSLVDIGGSVWVTGQLHGHDLGGVTRHEHDVTVNQPLSPATSSLRGTTPEATYAVDAASHLPPYRKLLFIMKTNVPASGELQWIRCESITVSAGQVRLTWPSLAGRRYRVEYTPTVVTVPFSCLASNVPAAPPRNIFQDVLRPPQGFYRLREEP